MSEHIRGQQIESFCLTVMFLLLNNQIANEPVVVQHEGNSVHSAGLFRREKTQPASLGRGLSRGDRGNGPRCRTEIRKAPTLYPMTLVAISHFCFASIERVVNPREIELLNWFACIDPPLALIQFVVEIVPALSNYQIPYLFASVDVDMSIL